MSRILDHISAILSHPSTSAEFSWTEVSSALGKAADNFIIWIKCSEVWLWGPVLYKLFQGCPFRLRAGAASGKRKWWWSKMTTRSARNTRAKNQSPTSPDNCSRPVPPGSWKEPPGASAAWQHHRAPSCQAPQQPLLQSGLPACSTPLLVTQQLSWHPWRELFQLSNILSKSMHHSAHLLQAERILLRTYYVFQNAGKGNK